MEEQKNYENNTDQSEVAQTTTSEEQVHVQENKSKLPAIAAVIVVIVVAIAGLYMLEKQGSISTGIFGGQSQTVATVNGSEIDSSDLQTSLAQISSAAELQGIDVADPAVQADLQSQAIEMLVNTELLEQSALEAGIVITNDDVENRIDELVEQLGSEQQLRERMALLGINDDTLREDVRSELAIQGLLDQIFQEEDISVTEDEIEDFFEVSVGPDSELSLDEIRPQIESQLTAQKEQLIIDQLISDLRAEAEISVGE